MKREAIIRIFSKQKTDNDENKGEMTVVGTISHDNENTVIKYVENNEETGPEETEITVFPNNSERAGSSAVKIVSAFAFCKMLNVIIAENVAYPELFV